MSQNATKNNLIVDKTVEYIKNLLEGEETGHDWWHTYRVWQNAKLIMSNFEKIDFTVVELAALLHDIADWKFNSGDDEIGPQKAREHLSTFDIDEVTVDHICSIIYSMSFKGANVKNTIKTIEGQIVQDADRLDALGAIGVARAFAYGAYAKQELYNPEIKPKLHNSYEEYKTSKTTTINHFYEKLLLLKDKLNTEQARDIAQKRHDFMISFLDQFYKEWNGIL